MGEKSLKQVSPKIKPKFSKGERKGWVNISEYIATPVNAIEWQGEKVEAYPGNRFGLPKLVP